MNNNKYVKDITRWIIKNPDYSENDTSRYRMTDNFRKCISKNLIKLINDCKLFEDKDRHYLDIMIIEESICALICNFVNDEELFTKYQSE